ncbi:hypothetical protein ACMA5I_15215 [Paracoccaceae bacterium GXU_MW_L88]
MLWGAREYDSGHQNLRRALSDLRKQLGDDFDDILTSDNEHLQLRLENCVLVPSEGAFLQDLNIRIPGFAAWLEKMRREPEQLAALGRLASEPRGDAPRITALSFHNGKGLDELGDWIAEELCRDLARSGKLTVISPLSSRQAAGDMVNLKDVRTRLGVDFLLAGSVRSLLGETRVDIDFIDMVSGAIIWSRTMRFQGRPTLDQIAQGLGLISHAVLRSMPARAGGSVRSVHGQTRLISARHPLASGF